MQKYDRDCFNVNFSPIGVINYHIQRLNNSYNEVLGDFQVQDWMSNWLITDKTFRTTAGINLGNSKIEFGEGKTNYEGFSSGDTHYARINIESIIVTETKKTGLSILKTNPRSSLDVAGAVQISDDTATASATKEGAIRYRKDSNNSYVEACMQTGVSTYAWIIIKQNNW
jgi:hypothetical protein